MQAVEPNVLAPRPTAATGLTTQDVAQRLASGATNLNLGLDRVLTVCAGDVGCGEGN